MSQFNKTRTIPATTLQREVGIVTRRVYKQKEHVIVERGGFPIVAIIPIDEYEQMKAERLLKPTAGAPESSHKH